MMKIYSTLVVLLLLFISTVQAQNADYCLDPAAAKYLVNEALNVSFPDPDSDSISSTITALYNILSADSSAYALNLYLGYDSGHFISVQNCNSPAPACYYTESGYFATVAGYGDEIQRYYAIAPNGTANPSNPAPIQGAAYNVTSRPFYNANGWSASYPFVNLATTGRTYEQTQSSTGAHIASDRLSSEPCAGPLATSPAILAAMSVSAANNLDEPANITQSAIMAFLNQLKAVVANFQTSANGLASIGVGYNNGDFYSVTDCNGLPPQGREQECSSSQYYAEYVSQALYGNTDLQVYNFATGALRNSGTAFNTTARPWFVTKNGWTDPYTYQTGAGSVTSRSYAAAFNGGVAEADPNPAFPQDVPCPTASATVVPSYSYTPTYSPPPSCPTPTPSPCGCASPPPNGNGNNNDDSVTINFYFADILNQS